MEKILHFYYHGLRCIQNLAAKEVVGVFLRHRDFDSLFQLDSQEELEDKRTMHLHGTVLKYFLYIRIASRFDYLLLLETNHGLTL